MNKLASKKTRTRLIPLVLFTIFVFIPQGATASLVVCFESDGQINVEAAHQGACYQSSINNSCEIHSLPSSEESSLMQTHYAPCFDMAISLSDLEQNIVPEQGRVKSVISLLNAVVVLPQSLYLPNAKTLFFIHPPMKISSISSLSSTILLI